MDPELRLGTCVGAQQGVQARHFPVWNSTTVPTEGGLAVAAGNAADDNDDDDGSMLQPSIRLAHFHRPFAYMHLRGAGGSARRRRRRRPGHPSAMVVGEKGGMVLPACPWHAVAGWLAEAGDGRTRARALAMPCNA